MPPQRPRGWVHFVCAGNSGTATVRYPASISSVNSVSAVNSSGGLASFGYDPDSIYVPRASTFTQQIEPVATASGPDDCTVISGTSFACPYAAGVAALIISQYPSLTARTSGAAALLLGSRSWRSRLRPAFWVRFGERAACVSPIQSDRILTEMERKMRAITAH